MTVSHLQKNDINACFYCDQDKKEQRRNYINDIIIYIFKVPVLR